MPHRKAPPRPPTRGTTARPRPPRRGKGSPRPTPMPRLPIGGSKKAVIAKQLRRKRELARQKHRITKLRDVKKQKGRA